MAKKNPKSDPMKEAYFTLLTAVGWADIVKDKIKGAVQSVAACEAADRASNGRAVEGNLMDAILYMRGVVSGGQTSLKTLQRVLRQVRAENAGEDNASESKDD